MLLSHHSKWRGLPAEIQYCQVLGCTHTKLHIVISHCGVGISLWRIVLQFGRDLHQCTVLSLCEGWWMRSSHWEYAVKLNSIEATPCRKDYN